MGNIIPKTITIWFIDAVLYVFIFLSCSLFVGLPILFIFTSITEYQDPKRRVPINRKHLISEWIFEWADKPQLKLQPCMLFLTHCLASYR